MLETVSSLGYADKLGKYGFKPNLCASKEQCEEWLDFCKKNNMRWLDNSYGTLVHKDFNNHFINLDVSTDEITKAKIELGIINEQYFTLIRTNHTNVLKSKINDSYIVTSYIEWIDIKKYPYSVYIIHPSLMEDYSLCGINIAFCNWTWNEYQEINKSIYEDIGIFGAFRLFSGQWR